MAQPQTAQKIVLKVVFLFTGGINFLSFFDYFCSRPLISQQPQSTHHQLWINFLAVSFILYFIVDPQVDDYASLFLGVFVTVPYFYLISCKLRDGTIDAGKKRHIGAAQQKYSYSRPKEWAFATLRWAGRSLFSHFLIVWPAHQSSVASSGSAYFSIGFIVPEAEPLCRPGRFFVSFFTLCWYRIAQLPAALFLFHIFLYYIVISWWNRKSFARRFLLFLAGARREATTSKRTIKISKKEGRRRGSSLGSQIPCLSFYYYYYKNLGTVDEGVHGRFLSFSIIFLFNRPRRNALIF